MVDATRGAGMQVGGRGEGQSTPGFRGDEKVKHIIRESDKSKPCCTHSCHVHRHADSVKEFRCEGVELMRASASTKLKGQTSTHRSGTTTIPFRRTNYGMYKAHYDTVPPRVLCAVSIKSHLLARANAGQAMEKDVDNRRRAHR